MKKLGDIYSPDEWIVLGLALSIFLSIYLTLIAMIAAIANLALQKRIGLIMATVPRAYYLVVFSVTTLLVSIFNLNLQGLIFAAAIFLVFLVAIYVRSVMTIRLFEAVLNISCVASLFSSAVIILQVVSNPNGLSSRAASTFMNANFYAAIIEMVVLFCVYNLVKAEQKYTKFYVLVIAMNLIGLYLCNSRTAMLALVAAVGVFLLLSRQYRALLISIAAGLSFLAIISQFHFMQDRFNSTLSDLDLRISIWKTAVSGILNSPLFGRGSGSYQLASQVFGGPVQPHAHNLLLDPLLNYGLAGVALLAAYLKHNFKAINRLQTSRQENSIQLMIYGLLTGVVIHGLTDITLFSLQTGLLFFMVLGSAGIREDATQFVPALQPVRHPWTDPAKRTAKYLIK